MKKLFFAVFVIALLSSCKPAFYVGDYGQVNKTQVTLASANFVVLGSFKGVASERKMKVNVRNMEGLISKAKEDLLSNARRAGVELTGSRALANVAIDVIQNSKMVTVTMSAEIVEFTR